MAQKVIIVILALIIVGGLAWYFNKTYLQPSSSGQNTSTKIPQFRGSAESTQPKLIYTVSGETKEIWLTDSEKQSKKLFTDADETEKIIQFSNLALFSNEVLAITSNEAKPFSGKLVSIDLKTAKESILQKTFAIPSNWAVSQDGKKIAYTKFSNLEDNYGFTLYSQDRDGGNVRELTNSSSEIRAPSWDKSSTKIAFVKISETTSEISLVDTDSAKTEIIKSFENKIVDWISWSGSRIVFSLRDLDNKNQGAIEIIDADGKNLEKITDFEGGIANFAYLENSSWLGFLITQDSTTGQIYIEKLADEKKIPIQKGSQILGWLPEG